MKLLPFIWRWSLQKPEIRALVRPLRRLVTPKFRRQASLAAAAHFVQTPHFKTQQHFACYMAISEEMDAMPIIEALWKAGKSCYLPVLSENEDKKLRFALYEEGMELALNRHRVLEPRKATSVLEGPELDVVILPLVAFDLRGDRLGTGGGYYDRTFSFVLERGKEAVKPRLLGLGYGLQQVEEVPREAFDVPVGGVITEQGFLDFINFRR